MVDNITFTDKQVEGLVTTLRSSQQRDKGRRIGLF